MTQLLSPEADSSLDPPPALGGTAASADTRVGSVLGEAEGRAVVGRAAGAVPWEGAAEEPPPDAPSTGPEPASPSWGTRTGPPGAAGSGS